MSASYKPAQVAELIGVSVDTVRRWCDEGRLETTRTDGGHRLVNGASLAHFLTERSEAYEPESLPAQSARNRFTGIVTRAERDGLTAIVEIQAGPHRVVSLMTSDALDDMQLEVGHLAVGVVKATTVIVEVPHV